MKKLLFIIIPIGILLISFTIKDNELQKIVVIVKDRNASTTYSESDAVICTGQEIGKVDSVKLIGGDPVYFITIHHDFRIPEGSKVMISDRSLFDKQIEFICSAQSKYKQIDTLYINPNPDDNKFKYTLEYTNLNIATSEEKVKLTEEINFISKFDSLNFNSYSKTGPFEDFNKSFIEFNNFLTNDTIINKK